MTTRAPARTASPGEKASATWAAHRIDDAPWTVLAASSPGTYSLPVARTRWSVAFVCANEDNTLTTVYVHHRTSSTMTLDVELDERCTPPAPPADYTFTGNITNVPTTAQWLDFGYPRDSRGVALNLPVAGASAYEMVGIEPGTWDLAFGIRDDPSRALTRVVIRRGEVVSADRTMDVDITGPGSFVPEQRPIVVRGIGEGDSVGPRILYGARGLEGIDVGPQDVPPNQTDVTLAYSVVPDALVLPDDRYRGQLHVEHDRRSDSRKITFDFHQPLDLDLMLLPSLAEPAVRVLTTTPQVTLETKFAPFVNALNHDVYALSEINRRTQHGWRTTYDAAMVGDASEVVDTMPDFSSLAGWKGAWALPVGVECRVFTTATEPPQPLGDGKIQRTTAKAVDVVP